MEQISSEKILQSLMHEVRQYNSIMRQNAELISRSSEGKIDIGNIKHASSLIFETTYYMTCWLDYVELMLNPALFFNQNKQNISLYGIFFKAIKAMKRSSKKKGIDIKQTGTISTNVPLYSIIEIIPYLLLDNCIKYSPQNSKIEINFYEDADTQNIIISSIGPHLYKDEELKIFEFGYRGEEAKKTGICGEGLGLFYLKLIIEQNDGQITFKQDKTTYIINDIQYSNTEIKLFFLKNIYCD
jgi:K+-sensing histidine kinase KdpD